MASIPSNVILIWPGSNASIPVGWVRETSLDDKYPKGHGAENPNVSGGSNTHSHTSSSHVHTMANHTHTAHLDQSSVSWFNPGGDNSGGGGVREHQSNIASDNPSGGSLQGVAQTWGSVNQEPPYYKVIFIKPSGVVGIIQNGICAHYNDVSAPIGWNFCDGANSTPDLRGKYLKGASAGADAGTTGGASTHGHDISHTHTANAHSHTGYTADVISYTRTQVDVGTNVSYFGHGHSVTFANSTVAVTNYSNTTAGNSDTVEPVNKALGVIKNAGGSLKLGIVALWLGSVATIPKNWVVCDGNNGTLNLTDAFIKIPTTLAGKTSTPAGSNTHAHSAIAHTHASTAHIHTGSAAATPNVIGSPGIYAGGNYAPANHTHSVSSVQSIAATYSTDNLDCNSTDHQPSYLTAAYIQLNKLPPTGAALLMNLI